MTKSKCNVRVVSSTGFSYTTRRGARRLIARGLATGSVDSGMVSMVETDVRYECEAPSVNRAKLAIVARNVASGKYRNDVLGLPNFVGIQRGRVNAGRAA